MTREDRYAANFARRRQDLVSLRCNCRPGILGTAAKVARVKTEIKRIADLTVFRIGGRAGQRDRDSAPMTRILLLSAALSVAAALAGCASYHALPLARGPDLATHLADLDLYLPAKGPPSKIDIGKPLGIDQIGLLAILNDPALKSERGEMGLARAARVEAGLLPNPSAGLDYAALLGGPGTTPSYTATLSQDVAAIVTYRARVSSARAHLSQVDADLLWREWQIAQKARLLALDIHSADRSIALSTRELGLLSSELAQVRAATEAGNLDLTALAPLLAAKASLEQSLASLALDRLKNWQALDALLGLVPNVRFAIAEPALPPVPSELDSLIASLPKRRPDLVALRLGYLSSDENVRAAILGQFPAFVLGGSWNSDTTGVVSAGPNVTFDLPIFNRNQGQIALARATRRLLHAQYQARLDDAIGNIRGLVAQLKKLSADLVRARRAAVSARSLSRTAQAAYAQDDRDQRSLTDYETTALQRQLDVVALARSLGEDRIILAVELGSGLPQTRIAPLDRKKDR